MVQINSERALANDCLYGNLLTCVLFTSENRVIMTSNEETTSRNELETIQLTEADIPGAKLTGLMDSHTMVELKWWLLCRGVKVPNSWNKKQLITRYSMIYCIVYR